MTRPQPVHVQAGVQVREVEGLVHLVGPDPVRQAGEVDAGFGAQDPVRAVFVQDQAPGAVDVVDGRLAEHGGLVAGEAVRTAAVGPAAPGRKPRSLDQCVGHVHAEAGDAAVQPETENALKLGMHGRVVPVEVRLGRIEEVQVPLVRLAVGPDDPRPGRSAEVGLPVVGRLVPLGAAAVAEDEHVPLGASGGCGQGGLERRVLVRAVVGDQVHDDPQAQAVGLGHHDVEVAQGAEDRVHVAVVADVIAGVALRRPVEGGQPDGVHVQVGQLRQFCRDAGDDRRCRRR